jgi:8-oxo-dGTP diphosphatase
MPPRKRSRPPVLSSQRDAPFVAAAAIFLFRGDRLLAMRRSPKKDAAPGAWEAISGRLQPGEQPHDAARRECFEETGLRPSIDPVPVTAYTAKRLASDMLVVGYRADSDAGEVTLSEEHDACAWMTLDEFAAACPFPPLVEAARSAARRAAPAAHVIVWEFRVRAGCETEFETVYGPDGDWAQFFRRDPAYLGTDLLRAEPAAKRYVTVDRWASRAACDAFRARFETEYAAIDHRCERLTEQETEIGRFCPIPGRVPAAR